MSSEVHLQMIQAIITRLASQSTTVKGWCITLTAALLTVSATAASPVVAAVAVYVIGAFAVLDAYYLSLERLYRTSYQAAVAGTSESWNLEIKRPSMRDVLRALVSPAIVMLYLTSLAATAGTTAYLILTT